MACIAIVVEEKAQKAALLDKLDKKGYNARWTGESEAKCFVIVVALS